MGKIVGLVYKGKKDNKKPDKEAEGKKDNKKPDEKLEPAAATTPEE